LFICHETTRTGAPFVLLYFLEWLKKNHADISITTLALEGGDLSNEFKKISDSFIDSSQNKQTQTRNLILKKINWFFGAVGSKKRMNLSNPLIVHLGRQNFDIIYAN